jgi:hypothetical protein
MSDKFTSRTISVGTRMLLHLFSGFRLFNKPDIFKLGTYNL